MANSYLESKAEKKKSAGKAVWVLILLAVIFVFVLVKFAMNSGVGFNTTGLPSNDDAYSVAKDFVKSTVRSSSINFPDSRFGVDKKSDSVYVIRTTAEVVGDSGDKRNANFKLLMHYNGGKQDAAKNWSLMNITEQ